MTNGYKQTEFGLIPIEWDVKSLEEMLNDGDVLSHLDGNHGSLYPRSSEFVESGVPYVSANCIKLGEANLSNAKYLTFDRAKKFKKGVAKNQDVLFAHNATVGPVAVLNTNLDFVILSTTLTYYRCNPNRINPFYLASYMQSPFFVRQYTNVMGQSTRNQVPITRQRKFLHVLPSLNEQTKIAEILITIDKTIEKTAAIIEQTEKIKKGLLQQLLTKGIEHTKFKETKIGEIPEEWDTCLLKDISTKITDGAHHTPKYTESGMPFLRVTDLKNEKIDFTVTKYISLEEHESLIKRCHPEKGDILLSKNGTIGLTKVIDWDEPFSIFVSLCLIKLKKDLVDPKYIEYFLQSEVAWKQIRLRSKQGTVTNLHLVEIKELICGIPTLQEQNRIVEMIKPLNEKLLKESHRLNQLIKIKKGLMQVLLTGKVRVKVDE